MNFTTDDDVTLYYEDSGSKDAVAVIFAHEFAGEVGSWDDQIAALKDDYRCVAYAARGWLPSEVPEDPAAYSIERAVADMIGLMDHLELEKAHVVGLSMGSNTTLQSALWHPDDLAERTLASRTLPLADHVVVGLRCDDRRPGRISERLPRYVCATDQRGLGKHGGYLWRWSVQEKLQAQTSRGPRRFSETPVGAFLVGFGPDTAWHSGPPPLVRRTRSSAQGPDAANAADCWR